MATDSPTNRHAGLRLSLDNYRQYFRWVYDAFLRAERELPPASREKRTHVSSGRSTASG
jgi:hypothetical protein